MHRFDSTGQTDRQTDGQSDGSQLCLHRGAWVQKPTILKLRQLLYVIVIGRKLLLGPGAQAPHFYDYGARLYDEPPTFVT